MRDLQKGDALTADWVRELVRKVRRNQITPGYGLRQTVTDNGTTLSVVPDRRPQAAADIGPPMRLGCSLSDTTLTVVAGSVRFHGIGIAAVAETEISLTASPSWVYVSVARAGLTASIEVMTTEPQSDYETVRLPLVVAESFGSGENIAWGIIEICHVGDFDFDLPLR